jgi:hypothetical protein
LNPRPSLRAPPSAPLPFAPPSSPGTGSGCHLAERVARFDSRVSPLQLCFHIDQPEDDEDVDELAAEIGGAVAYPEPGCTSLAPFAVSGGRVSTSLGVRRMPREDAPPCLPLVEAVVPVVLWPAMFAQLCWGGADEPWWDAAYPLVG